SALADVIKAGIDPYAHTAAMMLGVPVDEFVRWKHCCPELKDRYRAARQAAKPINLGVPGGLGPEALRDNAESKYGVTLTLDEARKRRDLLIKVIYPELELYLAEDGAAILARNLDAPVCEVEAELGDIPLGAVRKILVGHPRKADGVSYQPTFVSQVWSSLVGLNRNPELADALRTRQPGQRLAAGVCDTPVATLTGRIRGRVGYTQARNTPFQGLAADGAALALFDLVREGFRVVGFIHDEVLVELPDEGG